MAKNAAAPTAEESTPKKSGKMKWIVGGIIALLAVGGGAVTPMFAHFGAEAATSEGEGNNKRETKKALIPFDSVVVNVADGKYTRYLRVRITLVVDLKDEKTLKEDIEKEKPFLLTWVLGYLQDRTMDQLHGSAGMHRVRREVKDEFNRRMFPDGEEKIRDILLPEYNFQ